MWKRRVIASGDFNGLIPSGTGLLNGEAEEGSDLRLRGMACALCNLHRDAEILALQGLTGRRNAPIAHYCLPVDPAVMFN